MDAPDAAEGRLSAHRVSRRNRTRSVERRLRAPSQAFEIRIRTVVRPRSGLLLLFSLDATRLFFLLLDLLGLLSSLLRNGCFAWPRNANLLSWNCPGAGTSI